MAMAPHHHQYSFRYIGGIVSNQTRNPPGSITRCSSYSVLRRSAIGVS